MTEESKTQLPTKLIPAAQMLLVQLTAHSLMGSGTGLW